MKKSQELFDADRLKEGEMIRVEMDGKGVLVARLGEKFYAIGDRCTHMGCSLSGGVLEGSVVTCPCHGTKFDVTTGEVIAWVSKYPLIGKLTSFMKKNEPSYECSVEDNKVVLSIPEK